jgi:steroid 5-alpha reductase family enzyme
LSDLAHHLAFIRLAKKSVAALKNQRDSIAQISIECLSTMLALSLIANLIIFTAAWAFCVKIKNFSPVDAFWAFCIGLTAVFFLFTKKPSPQPLVAAILITAWSVRLGYYLSRRIAKHHPSEDSRYQKLREIWNGKVNSMFLLFFLGQALSVFLLALPFYLIAADPNPRFDLFPILGTLIASIGLIGETLADRQMSTFKAANPDPNSICQIGLWKYSRHPNYFFESIIWIGFFVFALGSPWGWTTIYAPAIITYLLLKVTGIPPTEASALLRKGDTYREYQRTTSPFIPRFKFQVSKSNEESSNP